MHVIGTAGHVDHGKSTLIAALTGIHPDRLKEEQEREMTIDLGFAWMQLPNGEPIGIVDVPGHRDFIENMLAGVGGIDAVLFVVAADEGVMPQTREHLAIVDILQIKQGIIVLTKIDMIDDPDWIDLVELDVHQAVANTVLADAPIIRVSAKMGLGLDQLKIQLSKCLEGTPVRPDLGRPRLPVDRVFTIAGFGTVVTGTLLDGIFRVGDEVEVMPGGLRGRIRGLQTHKRKAELAFPGSRTAVNISGINVEQLNRGMVVVHPNQYRETQRLDVYFRLAPDASASLRHNSEVKLFIASSEVLARVRVIGKDEILPGEAGWLQLELRDPLVVVRGDRYILRRPSPGETLGGGQVLDAQPKSRHKRFSPQVLQMMEALSQGSPAEVLYQAAFALGASPIREVLKRARMDLDQGEMAVHELLEQGQLILLEGDDLDSNPDSMVITRAQWSTEVDRMTKEIAGYHKTFPLRRGLPREALKSKLKYSARYFQAALQKWITDGAVLDYGGLIAMPTHQVRFTPQQQEKVTQILKRFEQNPFTPPSVKEVQTEIGEELMAALIDRGELTTVSEDVVFRTADYDSMKRKVIEILTRDGTITAAQFRDLYNTSRKYALAFLEHLDAIGITIREGDFRRLRSK